MVSLLYEYHLHEPWITVYPWQGILSSIYVIEFIGSIISCKEWDKWSYRIWSAELCRETGSLACRISITVYNQIIRTIFRTCHKTTSINAWSRKDDPLDRLLDGFIRWLLKGLDILIWSSAIWTSKGNDWSRSYQWDIWPENFLVAYLNRKFESEIGWMIHLEISGACTCQSDGVIRTRHVSRQQIRTNLFLRYRSRSLQKITSTNLWTLGMIHFLVFSAASWKKEYEKYS